MNDDYDHARRLAASAIAYLHACGGTAGRRDSAGEHAVLLEMVGAMAACMPDEQQED